MSSIITFTYCSKWTHLIYKALSMDNSNFWERRKGQRDIHSTLIPGFSVERVCLWAGDIDQTGACRLGKHQNKYLSQHCGLTSDRQTAPTACTSRPPSKSVNVDFKNACAKKPPDETQQNTWIRRRPSFSATARKFRDSVETSSPGKPLCHP